MLTDEEKGMLERLEKRIVVNGVSNDFLVKLCEVCETYLNPLTVAEYAKRYKMSYNGVKNHREQVLIFKQRFIIDNE